MSALVFTWLMVASFIFLIPTSFFCFKFKQKNSYTAGPLEPLGWVAGVFALVAGFAAIGGVVTIGSRHSCSTWAHRNGYEWHYSGMADGCQVKVAGQWISSENVIVNTESK